MDARIWLGILVAIAGCFSPAPDPACAVRCGVDGPCPLGFDCLADQMCHASMDEPLCSADGGITQDDNGLTGCVGHDDGLLRVCFGTQPVPTMAKTYTGTTTIDTSGDSVAGTGSCTFTYVPPMGAPVCVIAFTDISVDSAAIVNVIGIRPLVMVAIGELTVAGTLDASSTTTRTGPGANDASCNIASVEGMSRAVGGGGAGGSFAGRGGTGGRGGSSGGNGATGLPGTVPSFVRGGCAGGYGGRNGNDSDGGFGGGSGGAIYLIAGNSISVAGKILANGHGGQGASTGDGGRAGGGGGGSGGLIGLDANFISFDSGQLGANGGGGGGGSALVLTGSAGSDPVMIGVAAQGGIGASGDGNGGAGSSGGGGAPGVAGVSNGGGGGGGGAGLIRFSGPVTGPATISPPPS